jgi:hypothetical protein
MCAINGGESIIYVSVTSTCICSIMLCRSTKCEKCEEGFRQSTQELSFHDRNVIKTLPILKTGKQHVSETGKSLNTEASCLILRRLTQLSKGWVLQLDITGTINARLLAENGIKRQFQYPLCIRLIDAIARY